MKDLLRIITTHKPYRLFILFAACLLPLSFSFFSQYILDIMPCHMCVLERWPYIFILFFTLILSIKPHLSKPMLKLMILSILASLLLSFYHMGIEYAWWAGSEKCSGGTFVGSTAEELAAFLETVPVRRCDQSSKILGIIPFSSLNALYSLLILFYYFINLRNLDDRN